MSMNVMAMVTADIIEYPNLVLASLRRELILSEKIDMIAKKKFLLFVTKVRKIEVITLNAVNLIKDKKRGTDVIWEIIRILADKLLINRHRTLNSTDMSFLRYVIIAFLLFAVLPSRADDELQALHDDLRRVSATGNRDSIATVYCLLGEYYAYRSVDTALMYSNKALETIQNRNDVMYNIILCDLGYAYFSKGDIDRALDMYLRAKESAAGMRDTTCLSTALTTIGLIYKRKGMPDSTLVYYKEALQLLENSRSYSELAALLCNISIFYINEDRYEEGAAYGERAIKVAKEIEDVDMMMYGAYACGSAHFKNDEYDKGINYIRMLINEARRHDKPQMMMKGCVTMLRMFDQYQRYDSLEYYMSLAEELSKQLPENSQEVIGYVEMKAIADGRAGRYRESLAAWQRLETFLGKGLHTPPDKLYLYMARDYKGMHEYRNASECYEKAILYADSLRHTGIERELSELSVKYDTKEKELEIAKLQSEHMSQRVKIVMWASAAVVAVLLLIIVMTWYMLRRKRMKKELELELSRSRIDGMERERARIAKELHDGVCNDLFGIGLHLQASGSDALPAAKVLELIEQVRGNVRHISHELMPPKFNDVSLQEVIEDYVGHISSSLPVNLKVDIDCDLPENIAYETYRILQELLADVIKYSGADRIDIEINAKDGMFRLKVSADNGHGLKQDENAGIGLRSIRERADSINGNFSMDQNEDGQIFLLEVPLRQ